MSEEALHHSLVPRVGRKPESGWKIDFKIDFVHVCFKNGNYVLRSGHKKVLSLYIFSLKAV